MASQLCGVGCLQADPAVAVSYGYDDAVVKLAE